MSCINCPAPKLTCGEITSVNCIEWEIPTTLQEYLSGEIVIVTGSPTISTSQTIPISELAEESCVTLAETLEDIYGKFETIEETLDLTEWTSECIDFGVDTPTLERILTALDSELCDLKEAVEELGGICDILDMDITGCEALDFSCFETDGCDNPITITTLKDLLQVMIDKICELESVSG